MLKNLVSKLKIVPQRNHFVWFGLSMGDIGLDLMVMETSLSCPLFLTINDWVHYQEALKPSIILSFREKSRPNQIQVMVTRITTVQRMKSFGR